MQEENTKKRGKAIKIIIVTIAVIFITLLILCFIFIDNKNIEYDYYEINQSSSGNELKIVHLSDLHFPKIKVDIDRMLKRIEEETVDFIAITGDIIDSGADVGSCGVINFIEKLVVVAPIYYVNGNHEKNHPQRQLLYETLRSNGVIILENKSINASFKGKEITIIGLTDNTGYDYNFVKDNPQIKKNYKVLLAHRPEKWAAYISADNEVLPHLILTGHAHGGQIRFFSQGLVAPDQGLFPKFDSGLYSHTVNSNLYTQTINMIISRGLGNSIIPFRFNNKPHIPIITVLL